MSKNLLNYLEEGKINQQMMKEIQIVFDENKRLKELFRWVEIPGLFGDSRASRYFIRKDDAFEAISNDIKDLKIKSDRVSEKLDERREKERKRFLKLTNLGMSIESAIDMFMRPGLRKKLKEIKALYEEID